METLSPPLPAIDLNTPLYFQLVYTLTDLLPPPLDDTQQGLRARNHAAIAKVAALLPVNANEADLAAQCIAARAQAEEMLRLLRQNTGDIGLVIRLNAQYGAMVRTSLSVHGRLMRVQALRRKREAIGASANEDAWTLHVAERSMLKVLHPDAARMKGASPRAAPNDVPRAAPNDGPKAARVEPPEAPVDHSTAKNVSENGMNSHRAAFETRLIRPLLSRALGRPDPGLPHEDGRAAMTESPWAHQAVPANRRESRAKVDPMAHNHRKSASTRGDHGSALP